MRSLILLLGLSTSPACGPSPEASASDRLHRAIDATKPPSATLRAVAHPSPCRVEVKTERWLSVDHAAGTPGVAALMAELVHRNTEPHGVRLSLDLATGEVIADRVLPCAAVRSDADARALVDDLHTQLNRLHPLLEQAMQDVAL